MHLNEIGAYMFAISAVIVFSVVFYAVLHFGVTRIKAFAYIAMMLSFPSLFILFEALSALEKYL